MFREVAGRGFDGCTRCHGAFVEEKVLEEMFRAKGGHLAPAFEPWDGKPRAVLLCPVCQGAMAQVGLGHVPVDRCPTHGLWFARDELEEALRDRPQARAAREEPEEGESGIPQIVAAVIELILYLF
jgi:Zn-finger nucleic acid-binding protein